MSFNVLLFFCVFVFVLLTMVPIPLISSVYNIKVLLVIIISVLLYSCGVIKPISARCDDFFVKCVHFL